MYHHKTSTYRIAYRLISKIHQFTRETFPYKWINQTFPKRDWSETNTLCPFCHLLSTVASSNSIIQIRYWTRMEIMTELFLRLSQSSSSWMIRQRSIDQRSSEWLLRSVYRANLMVCERGRSSHSSVARFLGPRSCMWRQIRKIPHLHSDRRYLFLIFKW